jgi:hypothetical protein
MPQAIVIDEIGTKLEAMAASTIAQRGIQLVASAHGITIENLTMNPSLDMLVGGIQVIIYSCAAINSIYMKICLSHCSMMNCTMSLEMVHNLHYLSFSRDF